MITFPADLHDPQASRIELAVLIAYLDEIVSAIDRRERRAIQPLLDDALSTHLPRDVREELAMFAAQHDGGFRAPIRFLRFRFRMFQLAAADEPFDDPQLELDLGRGAGWRARYVDDAEDDELTI